ncbi:MAG: hypothetical protein ACRDQF_16410, partial [Thermocrispum sp.]
RNGATVLGDSRHSVPALQVLVANDGTEKSRLLVHLAAIDTLVIYQIQPCPFCSFDGGTGPDPAPASPGGTGTAAPTGPAAGTGAALPAGPGTSLTGPTTGAPAAGTSGPMLGSGTPIGLADAPGGGAAPPQAGQTGTSPGGVAAGLGLLARSPLQATLVAGVWLLFVAALVTALRRLRLRQLIST